MIDHLKYCREHGILLLVGDGAMRAYGPLQNSFPDVGEYMEEYWDEITDELHRLAEGEEA